MNDSECTTFRDSTSEKYSIKGIFKAAFRKEITNEQRVYYMTHYAGYGETRIGKPVFEMSHDEELASDMLDYNHSKIAPFDGVDCPICGNKEQIMYVSDGYKTYKECKCVTKRRIHRQMEECGLGGLLDIYTFEKYRVTAQWQKEIYDKAQAYIADVRNNWFVMLGSAGTGKSHICTAITAKLIENKIPTRFMSWLSDGADLKQRMFDGTYPEAVKKLKEAQGLYIDDLFKGSNTSKPSAADIKLTMEIINYRYNKARTATKKGSSERYVTIISSERTLQQLLSYDEAIASRIVEMAGEYLINIDRPADNYRLKSYFGQAETR